MMRPLTSAERALGSDHTSKDPGWGVLRAAWVDEDKASGAMVATFPAALRALGGKTFRISGYVTPLEERSQMRHLIITRKDPSCPFCPPTSATEAVEVVLNKPLPAAPVEIAVSGRLELIGTSNAGVFYRLADASLISDPEEPWVTSSPSKQVIQPLTTGRADQVARVASLRADGMFPAD